MMHFVRAFSTYAYLRCKAFVIEEVQTCGRIVFIKNIGENGWWEETFPASRHCIYITENLRINFFHLDSWNILRCANFGMRISAKVDQKKFCLPQNWQNRIKHHFTGWAACFKFL